MSCNTPFTVIKREAGNQSRDLVIREADVVLLVFNARILRVPAKAMRGLVRVGTLVSRSDRKQISMCAYQSPSMSVSVTQCLCQCPTSVSSHAVHVYTKIIFY